MLRILDRPLAGDDESTAMAASASTHAESAPPRRSVRTILLAGAGKMGGALLEGWLALGLAPEHRRDRAAPAGHLTALADRGVRLNPPRDAIGECAAVMVAVKPQVAPEVMPALARSWAPRPWWSRSWRAGPCNS
jgi:pyrroline-5-carboxylate reductase